MTLVREIDAPETAQRRRRGTELLAGAGDLPQAVVLSSFNADLLPPFLADALERAGTPMGVQKTDYGQIAQQALNPAAAVYEAAPEAVVVIPGVEDMLAPLFGGDVQAGTDESFALVDDRLGELESSVGALLERLPNAVVYTVVFGAPEPPVGQVLDPVGARRGQAEVERFLGGVRRLGELSPRVVVVDWDWQVRSVGEARFRDDRLWYLGRMRLAPHGMAALADLLARSVGAYRGATRKVIAVDLDDTVWGGIVGEAGPEGVVVGNEGVGLAFQDFQRELLKLRSAGVLLVAASKNNREDAVGAFERHPGMVLRLDHFVAERINWEDKASSLRQMAEELNLGLDSFVFLDDNPVEREWVSAALPEVAVPELPADPAHRPRFVRELPYFSTVRLTDADAKRSASYEAERDRKQLRASAVSIEDFLRSLEQVATIAPVGDASLARAAQLCQRTNQFNLTTRRHTEADIEEMIADDAYELYTLALEDRFNDAGITGLAIVRFGESEAEIDTFLLSCRVLGRRVEDALLAHLAARARARGCTTLVGCRIPTAKNAQTESFYPDRGFETVGEGVFRIELGADVLPFPDEIELREPSRA